MFDWISSNSAFVALVVNLVALCIVYLTLRKNSDALDLMKKDFERRYRPLKVEKVEYHFSDYQASSELPIAITFLNLSQQDIVVYELNLDIRKRNVQPLKFKFYRMSTVNGITIHNELKIPPGEERRVVYVRTVSEKEKESFRRLSLKGSRLFFNDNNSNNYTGPTPLEEFVRCDDSKPEITYS